MCLSNFEITSELRQQYKKHSDLNHLLLTTTACNECNKHEERRDSFPNKIARTRLAWILPHACNFLALFHQVSLEEQDRRTIMKQIYPSSTWENMYFSRYKPKSLGIILPQRNTRQQFKDDRVGSLAFLVLALSIFGLGKSQKFYERRVSSRLYSERLSQCIHNNFSLFISTFYQIV